MTQVNIESLKKRIEELTRFSSPEHCVGLSLNGEYNLRAYKMLLAFLEAEEAEELEFKNFLERDGSE